VAEKYDRASDFDSWKETWIEKAPLVEVRAKGAFHPGAGLHLCAWHAVEVPGLQCGERSHHKWSRRSGKDRASTILNHAAHKTGSHFSLLARSNLLNSLSATNESTNASSLLVQVHIIAHDATDNLDCLLACGNHSAHDPLFLWGKSPHSYETDNGTKPL
jgi:hypothetical protein